METEALTQIYAGMFRREMYDTVDTVGNQQVASILRRDPADRSFLKRLRDSAQVIALKHGNSFVYPLFQFDPEHHEVRPNVEAANSSLDAYRDPWGALAWWTSPNPRWERRRPIEHVDDPAIAHLAEADMSDDGF